MPGGELEVIHTDDDKQYHIRPLKSKGSSKGILTFDVKCNNDAHLALLSEDAISSPMIEIFLGGWNNSKSAIRLNQSRPDRAEAATPAIVSKEEFRRFWIRYKLNVIEVGKDGEQEPFLQWMNTEDPFEPTHIAFKTGWGSEGYWRFDNEEKSSSSGSESEEDEIKIKQRGKKPFFRRPAVWLDAKGGELPLRAVVGGVDGEKIYVGRAKHEGGLIPGKIVPSHKVCYVGCEGGEHSVSKYQVLVKNKCCELVWVTARNGEIPYGALQGGFSANKEPLFIARALHDGVQVVGQLQPGKGMCVVPYGGEEHCKEEYEVLVAKYIPL